MVEPTGVAERPRLAFVVGYPEKRDLAAGRLLADEGGRLLRQTLTGLGLPTSMYLTSVVKHEVERRGKKVPREALYADDRREAFPDLLIELDEVEPELIVALGEDAVKTLLRDEDAGINEAHGWYFDPEWLPAPVVPIQHPEDVIERPSRFRDLADGLKYVQSILDGEPPYVDPPYENYLLITDENYAPFERRLVELADRGARVAIDIETTGLDVLDGQILTVALSWQEGTAVVLDWDACFGDDLARLRMLDDLLSDCTCIYHNAQFDAHWLRRRGLPNVRIDGDTMLMHYCLDERQGHHGLKELAHLYYRAPAYGEEVDVENLVDEDIDDLRKYNGADADYTWRLDRDFSSALCEEDVEQVHDGILVPAVEHFIEFEDRGMLIDREYLEQCKTEWGQEYEDLEDELRSFDGAEELNLRSPKQVSEYLYGTLELEQMPANRRGYVDQSEIQRLTAEVDDEEAQEYFRSAPATAYAKLKPTSTNAYMLWWLAQQHDFPRVLVKLRDVQKRLDSYCYGILDCMSRDGRLRPSVLLHGTKTGRLSVHGPNIHGIPKDKRVKNLFVADPGYLLVHADYSQAEIRMVAHYAQDETLIQALEDDDIHSAIARELFGMTREQQDALPDGERKVRRRAAKTIAFGLIYGRTAHSLAPQIGVSEAEAEEYIERFFATMPKVRSWINRQRQQVLEDGEVRSLFGRVRRFDLITRQGKYHVQRQAVNMPIQSSVSDMTLLANLRIMDRLRGEGLEVLPWPHVHDGILLQVPEYAIRPAVRMIHEEMGRVPFDTEVPFTADVETAKRWGELSSVDEDWLEGEEDEEE